MGAMYEALRELEKYVNDKYKTGKSQVKITFVPLRPDQVEEALRRGVGDFIAYGLIVSPEREQRVAFTVPLQKELKQLLSAGPISALCPRLKTWAARKFMSTHCRWATSDLQKLNEKLKQEGKPLDQPQGRGPEPAG